MNNPTVLTLPRLITQKMNEKGYSRSQLIKNIGLSNISKGCRRLDRYLSTLEAPNDEFVLKLLSVLNINSIEFYEAMLASGVKASSNAKKSFKPFIQLLVAFKLPRGIAGMIGNKIHRQSMIQVPSYTQEKLFSKELDDVFQLVKSQIDNHLDEEFKELVIGFDYHRGHDHYLCFNIDLTLDKIIFDPPMPNGSSSLGDRLVNLMVSGDIS